MAGRTIYEINLFNMHILGYIMIVWFIAAVIGLLKTPKRINIWKDMDTKSIRMVDYYFAVFTAVMGMYIIGSHIEAYVAYQTRDYQTIEGEVWKYRTMDEDYKRIESFHVNDESFEYSFGTLSGGLRSSLSDQLKSGDIVRVSYTEKAILKVEIISGRQGD